MRIVATTELLLCWRDYRTVVREGFLKGEAIETMSKSPSVRTYGEINYFGFLTFTVTFYRKRLDNVAANDTANVTVNKTGQAVLALLGMHPNYTRKQLADATSKTARTMQRVLNSLRDKNLISREGSDKDGYWIVCSSVKK